MGGRFSAATVELRSGCTEVQPCTSPRSNRGHAVAPLHPADIGAPTEGCRAARSGFGNGSSDMQGRTPHRSKRGGRVAGLHRATREPKAPGCNAAPRGFSRCGRTPLRGRGVAGEALPAGSTPTPREASLSGASWLAVKCTTPCSGLSSGFPAVMRGRTGAKCPCSALRKNRTVSGGPLTPAVCTCAGVTPCRPNALLYDHR